MKQIFVGSTQRSRLYDQIRKALLPTRLVMVGIVALLLLISFGFSDKLFPSIGNDQYSNVVYIESDQGSGSAILIDGNRLLTCAHVLEGMQIGDKCTIEFRDPNGDLEAVRTEASILAIGNASNPEEDYALLNILYRIGTDYAKPMKIRFHEVNMHDKEDCAISIIGYPAGVYANNAGNISSVTGGLLKNKNLYAISGKSHHGNSGGALVDTNKQLLGIVIAGGAREGYNDDVTYAIKASKLKNMLDGKGFQL